MRKIMDVAWTPNRGWIENANISRLMGRLGFPLDESRPAEAWERARAFIRATQDDPPWFWAAAFEEIGMRWTRPYETVLETPRGNPWAEWFRGGETNIVLNCIDRHLEGERADSVALIAETEEGEARRFTYREMARDVGRTANALRSLGVSRGDCVACYMPMVAEVVFAMLATQKIGAIFIPIFSGYAAPAVRERLEDAEVKVLFTADGALRRGRAFPLKEQADRAVDGLPALAHQVVVRRLGEAIEAPMRSGRDLWWDELVASQGDDCPTESMGAMEPALMIYTSGTTGKPKGTVHSHAGCLAQMAKEIRYNFDLKDTDLFWWFSDIGWMMGPWEIVG
ncbi:MAG: AMP-binding protein, partial [Planctomycetota bacterium]